MTMQDSKSSSPGLGDSAPDFEAQTTHGMIRFSEWQAGRWVILFSHPAILCHTLPYFSHGLWHCSHTLVSLPCEHFVVHCAYALC